MSFAPFYFVQDLFRSRFYKTQARTTVSSFPADSLIGGLILYPGSIKQLEPDPPQTATLP